MHGNLYVKCLYVRVNSMIKYKSRLLIGRKIFITKVLLCSNCKIKTRRIVKRHICDEEVKDTRTKNLKLRKTNFKLTNVMTILFDAYL